MIFVNKKTTAAAIKDKLKNLGIDANILIGGIDNKDRDAIIDGFRKDKFRVLISTNVLARGIDVPQVDFVINYDMPIL